MVENRRQTVKIKDLGEVVTGTTPPTQQKEYFGGKYPFIKPSDISPDQRYIFQTEMTLSDEGCDYQKRKLLPKNSICVVCIGTIGKMCFTSKPSFTNQQLNSIIVDQALYEPIYIYYLLKTYITHVKHLNAGSASGRENVNKSSFGNLEIEVHELPIQRKIAGILSAYDDLIENNTRRIEILEEMARSIYCEWFVKFRFPGHEQVQMVDSELGLIPEGWEVKHLPDICSKVIDGTHDSPKPVNEGYYLVTGKHIVNGFIDFSKCYFISHEEHEKVMKRSKPEKGDTIFSNIGTLGSTAIVEDNFEFSIKNVALFKPLEKIHSCFIYLYFSSPETLETMEKKASGTSQRFFSLKFLRELDLVVPPNVVFYKFNSFVRPLLEERSLLNQKNHNLRRTRDLLLPRLISGEIDVENLDINTGEIAA